VTLDQPPPSGDPAPAVLASDADREHAVELLREACADGRLTLEDLVARTELAYNGRTRAELATVTADLGVASPSAPPAPRRRSSGPVVAVFGSASRRGPWVVPATLSTVALFGSCELDLREARLTAGEVDIHAVAVFGSIEIDLPDGVDVDLSGFALFGSKDLRRLGPPVPGAPLIRVHGFALFGSVEVRGPKKRKQSELT
jgi:hypothetical protein